MQTRTTVMALATAVALVTLVGCGRGSSNGGAGTLHDGIAAVKDSPESRTFFAWADQKALRDLTGISSAGSGKHGDPRWSRLDAVALPAVAGLGPQFREGTGIDILAGQRAMSIGLPPSSAERLDGLKTSDIAKQFDSLGATEERALGRSFLTLAAEGQVNLSNPKLGGDVFLALNRAVVSRSSVAFGLANAPVDAVLGGGKSLADAPSESAVADCLGDTIAAEVMVPPSGAASGVRLVGIGVGRPQVPKSSPREVLCEAVDKPRAGPIAATVRDRVRPDARLPDGYRVRDRVAQASVDQMSRGDVALVRVTMDLVAPARAGFLFFDQGPDRQGLAFLGGGQVPSP